MVYRSTLLCCALSAAFGYEAPAMINSWSPISNLSSKIEDMVLPWSDQTENKTGDLLMHAPIMHGAGGAHYINIVVGSPPQLMPVTLSANSGTTQFPCTGHNEKGFGKITDPEFAPAKSSTHRAATCASDCASYQKLRGFRVGGYGWRKREKCEKLLPVGDNHTLYGDRCVFGDEISPHAGWDAYTIHDKLFASKGNKKSNTGKNTEVKMGCQYQNTGMHNMTGLGLFGLGRGKSSAVISAYKDAELIKERAFSVCFSEKGGSFMLGKEKADAGEENKTKWVPASYSKSNWWKVEVTGVRVGETKVAGKMSAWSEGKGTLVDTVNTDTYIPAKLAPQFKEAFEKATGIEYIETFGLGQGYDMTEAQVGALPSLYFDLNGGDDKVGGTTIEVKPSAYTAKNEYKNGKYNYRLLLHTSDPAGGVLGANTLRNHRVTFDDENSKIGWQRMDCDKESKERAKYLKNGKPALYKMDGVEYFTKIGAQFTVKDAKKFDPLTVTKIPKFTQKECELGDLGKSREEDKMPGMDMGKKADGWTDTVKCIPKGDVAHNGIAPIVTTEARTQLNSLFASRIATGSGEHGEQPKDVKYKLFQVPIPERQILDNMPDLSNMTILDSRQMTAPGRLVVCHSVATAWVCHAPTATFFYAVKAQTKDKKHTFDLTVMCHSSSSEEPKADGTVCHVTGAGDIALYPEHYETGLSIIEQQQFQETAISSSTSTSINMSSALLFLVAGFLMAAASIGCGVFLGKRRRNLHHAAPQSVAFMSASSFTHFLDDEDADVNAGIENV